MDAGARDNEWDCEVIEKLRWHGLSVNISKTCYMYKNIKTKNVLPLSLPFTASRFKSDMHWIPPK